MSDGKINNHNNGAAALLYTHLNIPIVTSSVSFPQRDHSAKKGVITYLVFLILLYELVPLQRRSYATYLCGERGSGRRNVRKASSLGAGTAGAPSRKGCVINGNACLAGDNLTCSVPAAPAWVVKTRRASYGTSCECEGLVVVVVVVPVIAIICCHNDARGQRAGSSNSGVEYCPRKMPHGRKMLQKRGKRRNTNTAAITAKLRTTQAGSRGHTTTGMHGMSTYTLHRPSYPLQPSKSSKEANSSHERT